MTALLASYPAPAGIGAQMTTQGTICKMIAKCTQQGKSIDEAIDFAQSSSKASGGFRLDGCAGLGKRGQRSGQPVIGCRKVAREPGGNTPVHLTGEVEWRRRC